MVEESIHRVRLEVTKAAEEKGLVQVAHHVIRQVILQSTTELTIWRDSLNRSHFSPVSLSLFQLLFYILVSWLSRIVHIGGKKNYKLVMVN